MVARTNGYLARRIAITNCDLPLLIAVGTLFGGKIHVHRPVKHYRTSFQWYCYGDSLRRILTGILPYLIVKRTEAQMCLAFDQARGDLRGHKLTDRAIRQYQRLLVAVDELRRRTWTAADVPAALRSAK